MISLKVACNPLITDMRTSQSHIEAKAMAILSFKEDYNPPGKMVAEIDGSGGP